MVVHTPEKRCQTPFFVVGTSRSGTTMFRLMLNAHSSLSIPGETWFLSDLLDRLPAGESLTPDQVEKALGVITGHWRWQEWGIPDRRLEDAVRSLKQPTLADLIDSVYRLWTEGSEDVQWGDKTPGYTKEIARLHAVFPQARFVHIIRDGRDVCLSLKKTGWHGESTWVIAEYWSDSVRAACVAGRGLPQGQYLEVRYEQLVVDTEATLRSVCEFLGVAFEPAMLEFYVTAGRNIPGRASGHLSKTRRAPRESDIQRWRREQVWYQTMIFEAFAGPALDIAGYERRFPRFGLRAVRTAFRGLEAAASASLPLRRRLGIHFPGWRKTL